MSSRYIKIILDYADDMALVGLLIKGDLEREPILIMCQDSKSGANLVTYK